MSGDYAEAPAISTEEAEDHIRKAEDFLVLGEGLLTATDREDT
jgi:hypothetical protein